MKNESDLDAPLEELDIDDDDAPNLPLVTEKTPMPFGKYKGIAIGDVRASYLLWLADEWEGELWPNFIEYIFKNRKHLKAEAANEEYECEDDFDSSYDKFW